MFGMAALRQKRSITNVRLDEKPKKTASGQREMLMAISSKGEGKSESKSKGAPRRRSGRPASARLGNLADLPARQWTDINSDQPRSTDG